MWIWIWLGVTAASLVFEFLTMEIVSVWFVFGGLVSMLLAGLNVAVEVQIIVFIVVSMSMLLGFRRLALKHLLGSNEKTNAESSVGKRYKLLTDITKTDNGSIKINGVVWTATTEDEQDIAAGQFVEIIRIKGNRYIVKKSESDKK